MFWFIFLATCLSLSGFADSHQEERHCPDGKKHYRAAIRHIESGGIGYEDGYTTFEAFLASDPSQWKVTPFLDIRGHVFDNGKWAANAGVGVRTLRKTRAYGINAYYDYRNVGRFYSNQIGVGLETLGELFDFRINGYLPVGAKTSHPYDATFAAFSGHSMILSQKIQSAMKGADAELGFHFGKTEWLDCYAGVGPYYLIGELGSPTWGGKARVSGTFADMLTLEISDSYDRTFHNKFQGQIALSFAFGPKSKVEAQGRTCKVARVLNDRMLQSVGRQEIIAVAPIKTKAIAVDPVTGLPYFFVFVNNTSSSNGTYESPYHSLAQAQNNSSPNDIIYVFPGNGTTTGMDSGISLQPNQKFWGSGVSHQISTTSGTVSIPAQSSSSPIITNTNFDTDGNAIVLAANNAISGFTITSALNDAIYGTNLQSLDVSSCTIQNVTTFAIEATFPDAASVTVANNHFLNNVNGVSLTLNGTSTVACVNNVFEGQTSVSNVPLEIAADSNTFSARIENNVFQNNITGSIRFSLTDVFQADIATLSNTMTNNTTGSQSSLGSNFVVLSTGTIQHCSLSLVDNTLSGNASNSLYMHTSGTITTLEVTASTNTITNNGGSALVLATPTTTLALLATDNIMTNLNDNGIAIIASGSTSTGHIVINGNTITDIGNSSNGIAVNQDFSTLNLTIWNNEINRCQGTGVLSYAPTGIGALTLAMSSNTINHCENLSSNAASGIDIEQYTSFAGTITNNALLDNATTAVVIGSTLSNPEACLTLSGNTNSADYLLSNPGGGLFNLTPCNVSIVNVGTINTSGVISMVQSCSDATPCVP